MKSPIAVVLAVFVSSSLVFAQETPNFTTGTKALLFTFDGFSNLAAGNFEGGFGGKYYLSPSTALRAGVQLTTVSEDIPANPPEGSQGEDGELSASRFGVSGALEWHRNAGRVSPYLGLGLGFATTSTESRTAEDGNPPSEPTEIKNDDDGLRIDGETFFGGSALSFFGMAGVEFFLFKEVSLAAEYRFGFRRISRKDQEVTSGTFESTTEVGGSSGFGINSAGALTLAVYF